MDLKAWYGVAWIAFIVISAWRFAARQNKTRVHDSKGHPILDQLLLFICGLIVCLVMVSLLMWTSDHHWSKGDERLLVLPILAVTVIVLTAASRKLLRAKRK